jgi:hypothetical protein
MEQQTDLQKDEFIGIEGDLGQNRCRQHLDRLLIPIIRESSGVHVALKKFDC